MIDSGDALTLPQLGLGLDAGGTQTRWAIARATGELVAEGKLDGMSALQLSTDMGRQRLHQWLDSLEKQVMPHGQVQRAYAGLTGFGGDAQQLRDMLALTLRLEKSMVVLGSDVEIAYYDVFAPGEGVLVYAGTGSIAAYIDASGELHRAGGHGALLDDAGGGFWIAREALRRIWRTEDLRPGAWVESPMATEIFQGVGGSGWDATRRFVYGAPLSEARGEIGKLALAVAATAETDPQARAILVEAGSELARLAEALLARFGNRPVTATGRAVLLHPVIEESMRSALPRSIELRVTECDAHVAAARIAAMGTHGFSPQGRGSNEAQS